MRAALRAFEDRTGSYLPRTRIRPSSPIGPSCPSGQWLDRPRLSRQLDSILRSPATLLRASAGYGKTALLTQWFSMLQGREAFAAWLTLDARSHDSRIFLGEVIAALCEAGVISGLWFWRQGTFRARCHAHTVSGSIRSK